ncbi:hypothetical protein GCM10027346_11510 [Hymenobacter seoulensis]
MHDILLVLIMTSPLLWLVSVHLLRNWQYFWRYFICNLLVLCAHLYLTLQVLHLGHDEYGLKRLVAVLGAIVVHTLLGFGLALAIRYGHRSFNF